MDDRTGRPVASAQHTDQFIVENDEMNPFVRIQIILAQGEWSSAKETKTIVKRCNTRQQQTFFNMVNVYVFDITSICISREKIIQNIYIPSKIQERISQWNRCSTYLRNWYPNSQMRSMEWKQLTGVILHGSICPWLVMNKSSVSCTQWSTVFSDSVLCLGKMNENPQSNIAWEDRLAWFKSSPEYRALDKIDAEPMEFEWTIFPGCTTLQLYHKVQELLSRLSVTPEKFTGRIIFMSMFNDISWGSKDNKKECESNAQLVSLHAKRIAGQWSFLGPGSEKSGILLVKTVHKVNGTKLLSWWCLNSAKAHTQSSDPRVYCPEVDSKAKAMENCRYTTIPIWKRLRLFFRIIISVNQLSLCGAVAEMCEECESCHDRMGPVVRGQSSSSFVASVIKTDVLLESDDPANKDLLLQKHGERIETLSQQDKKLYGCRISECCWNRTIHHDERHYRILTISCSGLSWTHSAQETKKHHNQKDGSRETQKLDPC